MSPRRSSRARISQPAQNGPQHSSTSSSTSSGRGERNTRSNIKQDGVITSIASRSASSEEIEVEENVDQDLRRTRQNKRDGDDEAVRNDLKNEDIPDEEDVEDEGVTRCVCRQQDYPGPPVPLSDSARSQNTKDSNISPSFTGGETLPEDAGGLFIQCDICQVWQHGGCVGIMDEAMSPEYYYCEECRKDLHKIMTGARGQRYSRYLPVFNNTQVISPRKLSHSKDSDPRSSRESDAKPANLNAAAQSAKRRSTMNSRAAYDEEEVIRRVLEESKTEGFTGLTSGRKGKRGRDESEDAIQEAKRQKTRSESATPPEVDGTEVAEADSEDGHGQKTGNVRKKARGEITVLQREKELRERESEKERERAEAAGRRKGRAERRRIDESETPDEVGRNNTSGKGAATPLRSTKPQISSRQGTEVGLLHPLSVSHKKNGRPARRGRLGRNQYTKDRDAAADSALTSPHPSQSRDEEEMGNGENDEHAGQVQGNGNGNGSKPSKPRLMNPNRTSMNDMKRRVAGILEYISRTQIDIAGEKPTTGSGLTGLKANGRAGPNGASKLSHEINGVEEDSDKKDLDRVSIDEEEFKKLSSLDMMDVLTRELVHWQNAHGKWGSSGR